MERRTNIRYRLSANAIFMWKGAGHARLRAEGITRDISPLGAFVLASSCPPVDATIQVEIFLFLPTTQGSGPKLRIRTEAQVLRIDHAADQGMSGFAMGSAHFRFWPSRASGSDSDLANRLGKLENGVLQRVGPVLDDFPGDQGPRNTRLFSRVKSWI
jgi:hypothetical protein